MPEEGSSVGALVAGSLVVGVLVTGALVVGALVVWLLLGGAPSHPATFGQSHLSAVTLQCKLAGQSLKVGFPLSHW